jgi:CHAT domain-containing protein
VGLQVAGVPTIVASQWKAESKATTELMVRFHKGLVGGLSPAAALRDAQRAVRLDRRYRHPFYWAPFIVLGAGGDAVVPAGRLVVTKRPFGRQRDGP